jgi:hypothetical protein
VYNVKNLSQPDTIALSGNNYSLQIIEKGFAEKFYASHRMGPAPCNLFENFREYSLKQDLSNNTTGNPLLFSLINTFKDGGKMQYRRAGGRKRYRGRYIEGTLASLLMDKEIG